MVDVDERAGTNWEPGDLARDDLCGVNVTIELVRPGLVYEALLARMVSFKGYVELRRGRREDAYLHYEEVPPWSDKSACLLITGEAVDYLGQRKPLGFAPIGMLVNRGRYELKEGCIVTAWWREFPELAGVFREFLGRVVRGRSNWIKAISVSPWMPELDPQHGWSGAANRLHSQLEELSYQTRTREPRGPNSDTLAKVAKVALILRTRRTTKTAACELVPLSPKTYDRYRDHPDLECYMREVKNDPEFRTMLGRT